LYCLKRSSEGRISLKGDLARACAKSSCKATSLAQSRNENTETITTMKRIHFDKFIEAPVDKQCKKRRCVNIDFAYSNGLSKINEQKKGANCFHSPPLWVL
jgi:hypothetical protein